MGIVSFLLGDVCRSLKAGNSDYQSKDMEFYGFLQVLALKIALGLGICVILLVHRLWVRPQEPPGSEFYFRSPGDLREFFLRGHIMPNSPIRTNFARPNIDSRWAYGFNVYYKLMAEIAEHDKKSGKNYGAGLIIVN